jgi:DNA polymerase I-like protein with 3'-5' exonuclease and polymerase domains
MSSEWNPPAELPDLRNVGTAAIDTETKDDGLALDHGSGWPWHGGYVAGISAAWRSDGEIHSIYVPLHHPDSNNFDRAQVARWLSDLMASDVRIVGHNLLYDLGWLSADLGVAMPSAARLEDTGALAMMIDENRTSYKLESLCQWRGIPGKNEATLREGCKALGLIPKGRKKFVPQEHIWQLPARLVGLYAEQDPVSTLLLFEDLNPVLDREKTRAAYELEISLLPMVHAMRKRGIRIDTTRADEVHSAMLAKRCPRTTVGEARRQHRHD